MNYYDQLVNFYDFLRDKIARNLKSDCWKDQYFGAITFAYYSHLIDKAQYNLLLSKFD